MNCGVGRRCSSNPLWLWLWCRPAATALIGPLAWEIPYAMGEALKRKKKKTNTLFISTPKTMKDFCQDIRECQITYMLMQKPKRIYWPLSYILLFRYLSWMLDLELLKGRNLYFLILIFSGPSAEPGTEWTFSTCPFSLDLLPV